MRHRPATSESTRRRGIFYKAVSILCLAAFAVVLAASYAEIPVLDVPNPLHGLFPDGPYGLNLEWPLAVLAMLVAIFTRKKARRHVAPRYVDLENPPGVLYLRPFEEDTDWRLYYSWGRDRHPADLLDPAALLATMGFQLRMQFRGRFEFAEILSELTRDFGDLAAIGQPGSPPIVGADNVYVADDGWQEKVLEMARGARLVLLTAATSPGVRWETETMLRIVPPSRFLLTIPGGTPARRRKNYAEYCEACQHLFPHGLPRELKARVICFDDDWFPVERLPRRQPPKGTPAHVAWWVTRVLP